MEKVNTTNNTNGVNPAEDSTESKNDRPFISVMILCYNYGHLLSKALEACAAQSFGDFEIVMINNGATDNTEEVFQRFHEAYPEIRTQYLHLNQRDALVGWNAGMRAAKGEYVFFNDADDWMEPDCLEVLAQKAKETGADRVTGQHQEVLPDGTVDRIRAFGKKDVIIPSPVLHATIFRKAVIDKNDLYYKEKFNLAHDICFLFDFVLAEANGGKQVRKTIYNYYYNPKSVTQSATNLELRCKSGTIPLILHGRDAKKKTDNEEIKNEMEYLIMRNIFSSLIEIYQNYSKDVADRYYLETREMLRNELPGYRKNPLLWKIDNGYEKPGTIACMAVGLLDAFKAKGLMRLVAKAGRNSGLIRKNVSAEKDGEKSKK